MLLVSQSRLQQTENVGQNFGPICCPLCRNAARGFVFGCFVNKMKKIVVCVDGSEHSTRAFKYALDLLPKDGTLVGPHSKLPRSLLKAKLLQFYM